VSIDLVKISDLPALATPLTDNMQFPVAGGGTTYSVTARHFVLPADPIITAVDFSSSLPASRHLEAGTGISIVDGGAGGAITISASSSGMIIVYNLKLTVTPGASENNYDPVGWNAGLNINRLQVNVPGGGSTWTGLAASGAVDGQVVMFINDSATDLLTLAHESGLSTAANRFRCPGAGDFILVPYQAVMTVYDGTNSRWRILA
jgi:hypothetical protein